MSEFFALSGPWMPSRGETFEARMRGDPTWYQLVFIGWDPSGSGCFIVRRVNLDRPKPLGKCVEMRPWSPR